MNKNEIIKSMVKTFRELLQELNITWDSAYFRFSQSLDGIKTSQWSYLSENSLKHAKLDDDNRVNNHIASLETHSKTLFDLIIKETDSAYKPLVVVLDINSRGGYKITFNAIDGESMDIAVRDTKNTNSYFYEKETA